MSDIKKIKNEFIRIRDLGFIQNVKSESNDGAIGNTFEEHLGVIENNLKDPDFEGWEVKTKNQFSKTATTLFSRKPSHPHKGDRYMLQRYGVPDKTYPNATNLNTTVYCDEWRSYYEKKFSTKLSLDRKKNKLSILFKDANGTIDNSVYWTFSDLKEGSKKLKNTFIVLAEKKIIKKCTYFKYISAKAFIDFDFDFLLKAIENKNVVYEHRWSPDKKGDNAGKDHNHGGGFRFSKGDISILYNSCINIE